MLGDIAKKAREFYDKYIATPEVAKEIVKKPRKKKHMITESVLAEIEECIKEGGHTAEELAFMFNSSTSTIYSIIAKKHYLQIIAHDKILGNQIPLTKLDDDSAENKEEHH